ncbi:LysE/ArgO family amino acid transporter [Modicisalibacter radicis]|uniref:LysE/ArgO family amino acid transporter n=1 Tax=Halomonas sp. EAR18 TaxID=2518972 RepID=UPI00109C979C|nr:LysE family transporter [Halomonas sp. EAR18]
MWGSAAQGLVTGAGLIIAIGAQNAFVLGQGLRREHPWLVALICTTCDALLIVLGGVGVGQLIASQPTLMVLARLGGALFLMWQAGLAWRRALSPGTLQAGHGGTSRRGVIAATLAVTLLNPQVYLDTLIMLGAIGAVQAEPVAFYAGAVAASCLWFFSLVAAAGWLSPRLASRWAWRSIDGVIGAVLLMVAAGLVAGLEWP